MKKVVSRVLEKFIHKYYQMQIRTKINVFYFIILLLSFSISYFLYNTLNSYQTEKEISISSNQTLHALDNNLQYILNDVAQFSNLIFFNNTVQDALRSIAIEGVDTDKQITLNKNLTNMLISGDYISSVYLFDKFSNRYAMGKHGIRKLAVDRIEDAPWYDEVSKLEGGLIWVVNSGGVLLNNSGEKYISLIRVINDIKDYNNKIATLIVNVDEDTIQGAFKEIGNKNDSDFFIMDSKGNYIIHPVNGDTSFEKYIIPELNNDHKSIVKNIGNKKVLISFITSKSSNWKIVGVMPMNEVYKEIGTKQYIDIIVMLINSIFVSLGAFYITRLVTRPLAKMQYYMKIAEHGNLVPIPVDPYREDEISQLKKVFNRMVTEIQKLIHEVKEEQKIIRKNELSLIRAQINPHFLYNTLDAISALSLMGDSGNTFKIAQALGNFYQISLSSGREIITVAEEIECIKHYATILDIRYKGKFEVKYDVDEEILSLKILKLILQPIVENAIHHGLRNKHGNGTVIIRGYREEDILVFIIKDDGIGMSENKIQSVLNNNPERSKNGFGLYSSIQRISIFYNYDNPLSIKSEVGIGTEVTIKIPVIEEE